MSTLTSPTWKYLAQLLVSFEGECVIVELKNGLEVTGILDSVDVCCLVILDCGFCKCSLSGPRLDLWNAVIATSFDLGRSPLPSYRHGRLPFLRSIEHMSKGTKVPLKWSTQLVDPCHYSHPSLQSHGQFIRCCRKSYCVILRLSNSC